jgi:methyl-accepting chemotaxis protein
MIASGKPDQGAMRDTIANVLRTVMPSFVRRRYTVKFVVSILFVIVVITSVGVFGFVQAQETVRDSAESNLRNDANLQANYINTWVSARKSNTLSLSKSDTVEQGDPSRISLFLDQRITNLGGGRSVVAVHALDIRGDDKRVIASTQNTLQGTPLSELDTPWTNTDAYFKTQSVSEQAAADTVDENRVYTSDRSYRSPAMGGEVVSFGAVTLNEDRAIVLEANIGSVFDTSDAADVEQSALVTADGDLVRRSENASTVFGSDPDAASPDQFARTEGPTARPPQETEFAVAGGRVLAASDVGARTQWAVVTSQPQQQAFAAAENTGRTIGIIIATALVSLALVGVVLGLQTVTPLTELRRKIQRMEEGDLSVELQTTREDEIGRLYGGFASMRDSLQSRIGEIEATNRRLEQKATEYSAVMRACAAGDLTQRMEPGEADDSMAEIAREFNEMVEELETTTEEIKRFADQVAISSREVTVSADEVLTASEQVSDTVQEINEGAERQNSSLQEINADVEELSDTIDDIAASSTEVAGLAGQTVQSGREGRQAAQEAIADMDEVTEESEVAVQQMERLEEETQQIDELIEFVDEIARRTNMLALNANIEATRSESEADSGFGVIANEIKQLSEESQQATENIAQRLERIQEQTGEAADVVEQTSRQITDSAANVREAVQALQEVTEYAEETNQGIQSISEANAEQVETTTEVATEVEEVAEISTRTSREAETVAALAAEQTAAVTQVSASAGDLSDRAEQLSERLDDFETDVPIDATETTAGGGTSPAGSSGEATPGVAAFDPGGGDQSGSDDGTEPAASASFNPDAGGSGSEPDANDGGGGGSAMFDPGRANGASDEPGETGTDGPDDGEAVFQPASVESDDDGADESESESDADTGFRPMTDGQGDDGD